MLLKIFHPIRTVFSRQLPKAAAYAALISVLFGLLPPGSGSSVDLADVPMETKFQPAPANIMVIQDDSGSMDFDCLVLNKYDGGYPHLPPATGTGVYVYLFDNVGDDVYGSDSYRYLGGERRKWWKTQWHKVNLMYYNPSVTYEPWPTLANADPNNPKSHPVRTPVYTLNLDGTSYSLPGDSSDITGVEKIIDSHGSSGFSKTSNWSELNNGECYGANSKCWHTTATGQSYTAAWTPGLVAGWYYVEAWWRSYDSYSTTVPYTITPSQGSVTIAVNQRTNESKWNRLYADPFYFAGSSDEKVQILNYTPNASSTHACADAVRFVPAPPPGVVVPHSRYYVWSASEGKPYLVILRAATQTIEYYAVDQVMDQQTSAQGPATAAVASNYHEKVSRLRKVNNPPSDVASTRTYSAERQNFANWFSFYRRRRGVAAASLSNSLVSLSGVRVGMMGMNHGNSGAIKQPLVPVKMSFEGNYYDYTANLLTILYNYTGASGTPTRRALEAVGAYYKNNSDNLLGVSGVAAPYKNPLFPENKGGACQQCYAIIVTDGMENGNPPNTAAIDNNDGDNGFPYADNWSDTLADVAMYFYENDLNSALPDKLMPNFYDQATWQHLVTYGVTMGVYGTLNPQDYGSDYKHKVTGQEIVWPQPERLMPSSVDDMWHATVNSRGQYLNGDNYQELANALKQVIQNIASRTGSSASISVNGNKLFGKVGNEFLLYQPMYNTSTWSGDLRAYHLNTTTGAVTKTDGNGNPVYEWSAAEKLDARDWTTRAIASYNPDSGTGIAFDYANLTASQKSALNSDPNIVDFVKGRAVAGFRVRSSRLGDIVHSAPVFSSNTLYTGANDGMLHAFDADTGVERFAYVPNLVIENLKHLKESNYAHKYFVDQTPTVIRGSGLLGGGADDTVLVAGLGKGGKGFFALNVSSPESMTTATGVASKILWEYPRTSTPATERGDVGYSFSRPIVAKSNDSNHPWVVIFGNGYDSPSQNSVLFVLNARTGALVKTITAVDDIDNGLSTPVAIDPNNDGTVDFIYAGDLKGNLWKFDLTSTSASNWSVAFTSGITPRPLFKAKGPAGSLQPITTKPDVMFHPVAHGYMVVFGTGKYLADSDYSDTSTQSVYGIWDYGDRFHKGASSGGVVLTSDDDSEYLGEFNRSNLTKLSNQQDRISLLEQTHITDVTTGGTKVRLLSSSQTVWKTEVDADAGQMPNLSNTDSNHAGWYFDLPNSRERIISDVYLREGKAIVISFTPNSDPCQSGGKSFLMQLDAGSGGALGKVQFDINGDGKMTRYKDALNPGDSVLYLGQPFVPVGLEFDGNLQPPGILRLNNAIEIMYLSSSTGNVATVRNRSARLGITSWLELEE
jgi:type IV pilus assembly protein PilY1